MKDSTKIVFADILIFFAVLMFMFSAVILVGNGGSEEKLTATKACAQIHDDFWRDQCYSDIAKLKAKEEK